MQTTTPNVAKGLIHFFMIGLFFFFSSYISYGQTFNFEGSGETKSSYTSGFVTISGISWELDQALIGTTAGFDRFNGARSLRIRHRTTPPAGRVEMQSDISGGIGTISLVYAQYSGDPNPPVVRVEYSTNSGSTWSQAGSDITSSGVNTLTAWSATINTTVATRVRFRTISGNNSRRANIDDIVFSTPVVVSPPSVSITTNNSVSCPGGFDGSLTATITGGTANYSYLWSNGSVTGNTSSTTNTNSSLFATTYTVTVTDDNGLTATASATISTGTDNTAPTITVCASTPSNITANGSCQGTAPNLTGSVTATDNCTGSPTITQSPASGATLGLGTTTITLTATDGSGNTATCTVNQTVIDATAPTITVCASTPSNITANGSCQGTAPNLTGSVTATDNCTGSPTITQSPASGATLGLGTTTITLTATDGSGNTATCTVNQTVIDATAPTITVCASTPSNITANGSCQGTAPNLTGSVTATDNCTGSPMITQSPASGATLGLGTTTITLTATDGSGNTATCTVNQTVIDATAPTITVCASTPSNITANGSCQGTAPNLIGSVTATDNCIGSPTITQSPSAGATLGLGTTTITLTATDGSGNTSTCTVNQTVIDATAPTITVCASTPSNISANGSCQGTAVDLTGSVTATDNCTSSPTITQHPSAGMTLGLGTTTITLTATDGSGNTATCTVNQTVIDATPPTITVCAPTPADIIGNASNQGSALDLTGSVTATDNCTASPFITQSPATGATLGLGITTITLTASDGSGNTASCTVNQTVVSSMSASITNASNLTCVSNNDGSVTASVNGGAANYTYNWSNGATTSNTSSTSNTITGLSAGTYAVTITDANSLTTTASATIAADSVPYFVNWTPNDCNNGNQASATVSSVLFLQDFESYSGIYDSSEANILGDPNLDFETVSAIKGRLRFNVGFSKSGSKAAAMDNPRGESFNNLTQTIDLNGYQGDTNLALDFWWYDHGDEGDAHDIVEFRGDSLSPWFTVYSFATNSNNGSWTYVKLDLDSLMALNNQSLSSSFGIRFGQNDNFPINTDGISIDDISVYRENISYTYLWNTGDTNSITPSHASSYFATSIANVNGGAYSVTITDNNSCTNVASFSIVEPTLLVASVGVDSNATCNSTNDGGATVSATGGESPYTYAWNTGTTIASVNGLAVGTYSVTITDAKGCTDSSSVTINSATPILISTTVDSNATCNGFLNGGATATISGGVMPYTYNWSNAATTPGITGVGAGTYNVTITDSNGCVATSSTTITEPAFLLAATVTDSNATCNGYSDGGVTVSATGGTMPYIYTWSNADTTASITGLLAGAYAVTVTDANGCTSTNSVPVTEPGVLPLSTMVDSNVTCFGGSNGGVTALLPQISTLFFEGFESYTGGASYNSNTVLTGLSGVSYETSTSQGRVRVPAGSAYVRTGNFSVTLDASPSGASPDPINYLIKTWDLSSYTNTPLSLDFYFMDHGEENDVNDRCWIRGSDTSPWIEVYNFHSPSLGNGVWNHVVVDRIDTLITNAGQTLTSSFGIRFGQQDNFQSTSISASDGYTFDDISITTIGAGSATYAWSNAATTSSLTGVSAGTYTVTITNAAGCSAIDSIVVTEPTQLVAAISVDSNETCMNTMDGGLTATETGGTSGYSYVWSNGLTTTSIDMLTAGTYTVTITDANGCTSTATETIVHGLATSATETYTVCDSVVSPSGMYTWTTSGVYMDTLVNAVGCDSVITTNLTVVNATSSTHLITSCDSYTSPSGFFVWTVSGLYTDVITNAAGCDSTITFDLTIINSTDTTINVEACNAYAGVSGTQNWVTSGVYTDVITNAAGCDSLITVNLTVYHSAQVSQNPEICYGDSFLVGDNWYSVEGTYIDTLSTLMGCDSIVTTNLDVEMVDVSVTDFNGTLRAGNDFASSFQWINCDSNNAAVAGATGQLFTPTVTGNYAVVVNSINCSDTSDCFFVDLVGMEDLAQNIHIAVYPNPAGAEQGTVLVEVANANQYNIVIRDLTGKMVYNQNEVSVMQTEIDITEFAAGTFFIEIQTENGSTFTKLVVM